MAWVKIDDKIAMHPKIVRAGNEPVGCWLRLVAWSADQRTDGFVPFEVARAFAGPNADVLKTLTEVGLLDDADGGYRIHDYLEYNPSAQKTRERKEKQRAQRVEAGKRSAEARARRKAESSETVSTNVQRNVNEASTKVERESNPVPVPEPVPRIREELLRNSFARSASADASPSEPEPVSSTTIPLSDGSEHAVTLKQVAEWRAAFPGVDIEQGLRSARQWCLANPLRRKTQRGVQRFLTSWLDREQNRGGGRAGSVPPVYEDKKTASLRAAYEAMQVYNAQFETPEMEALNAG